MQLPDSYANLMQFVPERSRPMVEAAVRSNIGKANALQQELAQRQAALDEQRAIKQAQLQQAFSELDPEMQKFPAVQHDLKRQQLLNDMNYEREATMLSGYGEPSEVVQNRLKMLEEKYKQFEEDLKPIEQTKQYNTVNQNWIKINDKNARINSLISQIAETRKILDSGDKAAALQNIKTNLLKPLSNIDSDDAIQIGEVLLKFAPVLSAPETALLAGKNVFNPSYYFTKYLDAKNKNNEQEKQSAFNGLIENLSANPEEFLKVAIQGANGHIDSYNRRLAEQVINTTSPGVARRMGAVPMSYITPIEEQSEKVPQNLLATPNPFGQRVTTGAGTSTMAPAQAPMQQQAPAQQQAQNPLNAPIGGSTIFRVKQR